jgi:hypothetical protein
VAFLLDWLSGFELLRHEVVAYSKVLSRFSSGATARKHEKPHFKMAIALTQFLCHDLKLLHLVQVRHFSSYLLTYSMAQDII